MVGKFTPRSVFVDIDEPVFDEIKTGPMKKFYKSEQFVGGNDFWQETYGNVAMHIKDE